MELDLSTLIKENLPLRSARELTKALTEAIYRGHLAPGMKMPGVNTLSRQLGLNRLTILKSMEELELEGWIRKIERSGIYVSEELPTVQPIELKGGHSFGGKDKHIQVNKSLTEHIQHYSKYSFNDGYPDHRFFPAAEMARAFSITLKDDFDHFSLTYYDVYGQKRLREALSNYLHTTRGLPCSMDEVMVTKGSSQGIFLTIKSLCKPGDTAVLAHPSYPTARETLHAEGMNVLTVPADEDGLDTEALAHMLKSEKVRLVYVTPHHHYPTSVSMSAERRLELLQLSHKYGFFILEDDYDFEFHYERRPILPIASLGRPENVIYVGGFSKSMSPAIRLGYVVASPQIIIEMGKWRKVIDRQGDSVQELAFARLIENGTVERVIRKAKREYRERRDEGRLLLESALSNVFMIYPCQGGHAFWAKVNCDLDFYSTFREAALKSDIYLPDPAKYGFNRGVRLGFASMTKEEFKTAVERLSYIRL